jgi:hypothetical protein
MTAPFPDTGLRVVPLGCPGLSVSGVTGLAPASGVTFLRLALGSSKSLPRSGPELLWDVVDLGWELVGRVKKPASVCCFFDDADMVH